jgi:hypothetical protein
MVYGGTKCVKAWYVPDHFCFRHKKGMGSTIVRVVKQVDSVSPLILGEIAGGVGCAEHLRRYRAGELVTGPMLNVTLNVRLSQTKRKVRLFPEVRRRSSTPAAPYSRVAEVRTHRRRVYPLYEALTAKAGQYASAVRLPPGARRCR